MSNDRRSRRPEGPRSGPSLRKLGRLRAGVRDARRCAIGVSGSAPITCLAGDGDTSANDHESGAAPSLSTESAIESDHGGRDDLRAHHPGEVCANLDGFERESETRVVARTACQVVSR